MIFVAHLSFPNRNVRVANRVELRPHPVAFCRVPLIGRPGVDKGAAAGARGTQHGTGAGQRWDVAVNLHNLPMENVSHF